MTRTGRPGASRRLYRQASQRQLDQGADSGSGYERRTSPRRPRPSACIACWRAGLHVAGRATFSRRPGRRWSRHPTTGPKPDPDARGLRRRRPAARDMGQLVRHVPPGHALQAATTCTRSTRTSAGPSTPTTTSYVKSGDLTGTAGTSFSSLVPFVESTERLRDAGQPREERRLATRRPGEQRPGVVPLVPPRPRLGHDVWLRFDMEYQFMTKAGNYVGTDNPDVNGQPGCRPGARSHGRRLAGCLLRPSGLAVRDLPARALQQVPRQGLAVRRTRVSATTEGPAYCRPLFFSEQCAP